MTRKRWILISIAAIVTLSVWFGFYFRDVMSPRWSELNQARETAMQSGLIADVVQLDKHVWEEVTWVAEGKDPQEQEIYLFMLANGEIETFHKSKVLTEQELLERFQREKPDSEVIRISPGRLRGGPAWEIYYTEPSGNGVSHYYSFYRFDESAELLDTFRLPATTTGP
ncbi:hypothetical protein ACX93W_04910 [Paenibacillus sp. CAU 1782]